MNQPDSQLLETLRTSLDNTRNSDPNDQLVLNQTSLDAAGAGDLLLLIQETLGITQITLTDNVQIPAVVDGDVLEISGDSGDLSISLSFQDDAGQLDIRCQIESDAINPLTSAYPEVEEELFNAITFSTD